jgi:hypothetical protein
MPKPITARVLGIEAQLDVDLTRPDAEVETLEGMDRGQDRFDRTPLETWF